MARILALSSQVAFGPVGNTAAVPALQARGHEVLAVPTITLSNHPGHGTPAGFRTAPADLAAILARLGALGALAACGAVLTGYFAAPEQVAETAQVIAGLKAAVPSLFVLVDPVIGDGGSLYVPEAVAAAIRDRLLPLATCITPNRFELEWLSGLPVADVATAQAAARSLKVAEVVATSIPAGYERLATLAVTAGGCDEVVTGLRPAVPHGTGDFLAGLYLAARLAVPPRDALAAAMQILEQAIARSAGSPVLDVAGALHCSGPVARQRQPFMGIDGCKAGWLVVEWDGHAQGICRAEIVPSFDAIHFKGVISAAIDIPVGFEDVARRGGRDAEKLTRQRLLGRASTVFSSPARACLAAESYEAAMEINRQNSQPPGIGLSRQSYALLGKLNDVDRRMTPDLQNIIAETHPELTFAIMNNDTPVRKGKNTRAGQEVRRNLLHTSGFPIEELMDSLVRCGGWSDDDLFDACACAWSAKRIFEGVAVRLPPDPPRDVKGLKMQISA